MCTYRNLQKVVYNYVIENIKVDDNLKRELKHYCENDYFWTDCFDEIAYARDLESIFDVIVNCIEDVNYKMNLYFLNAWNFAPGYKVINIPIIDTVKITDKELIKMLAIIEGVTNE
jgi:hypothetical protein